MTAYRDLDQQLRVHLETRADRAASDAQLAAILDRTAVTRQRPSWLVVARSYLMSTRTIAARPAIPRAAWLVALGGVLLALLLAAAFIGGSHKPSPLINGRIVFGRYDQALGDTVSYTVNPDGTHLKQLRPEPHEAGFWYPDGATIGFTDAEVNADGSGHRVRDLSKDGLTLPVWDVSPDGALYLIEGFNDAIPNAHGVYTLRRSDGSGLRMISQPGDGAVPGTFSPDGRMVAFIRPIADDVSGALMVVNVDGTNEHQLGNFTAASYPTWAPDGGSLLTSSQGRLYRVDVQTGVETAVVIKVSPDAQLAGAAWSPDGTRILFRQHISGNNFDLFTMRPDGTDVIQVTNDPDDDRSFDWGTHPLD